MLFRYALMAAAALAVAGIAAAQAQSPFPPVGQQASPFPPVGQQASPFPPVGQQSPFPSVGQPQQKPPCIDDFLSLRQELDKRFETVKTTLERKPTAAEACSVLTKFTQSEAAMIKFVEKNSGTCPLPPNLLQDIKAGNVKSEGYRKQACTAAAAPARPARPAAPTLSDAFSAPVAGKDNTRTGRGTLDSLGGNPLAR
ncbi:MAG TPA: hypothetical protein VFK79_00250 [Xanthobacteraceae bacterium]|nr:hypothetical protein [Xanthobacteraceae bacterium]